MRTYISPIDVLYGMYKSQKNWPEGQPKLFYQYSSDLMSMILRNDIKS